MAQVNICLKALITFWQMNFMLKKEIGFSAHDQCWRIDYKAKKLSCEIGFEKDPVFMVVKFSLAKDNIKNFENMYDSYITIRKSMC